MTFATTEVVPVEDVLGAETSLFSSDEVLPEESLGSVSWSMASTLRRVSAGSGSSSASSSFPGSSIPEVSSIISSKSTFFSSEGWSGSSSAGGLFSGVAVSSLLSISCSIVWTCSSGLYSSGGSGGVGGASSSSFWSSSSISTSPLDSSVSCSNDSGSVPDSTMVSSAGFESIISSSIS